MKPITTPHRENAVSSIVGMMARKLDSTLTRPKRRSNRTALTHAEARAIESVLITAARAAQQAHRQNHLTDLDACVRVPEELGFVLMERLKKTRAVASHDLLRFIRLARELCVVTPTIYTGEISQRAA